MSTPDIETAELLARKSAPVEREVEFRRKLGIVFGDQVISALAIDIYHGIIPGKDGLFWKIAEPIVEEFKDVVDALNPLNVRVYSDKKPGVGFKKTEPQLDDVYFIALKEDQKK